MGEIYEVRYWDGLRCHDIHTKFHTEWLRQSKVDRGNLQTHRQNGDVISVLLFFQNEAISFPNKNCKLAEACVLLNIRISIQSTVYHNTDKIWPALPDKDFVVLILKEIKLSEKILVQTLDDELKKQSFTQWRGKHTDGLTGMTSASCTTSNVSITNIFVPYVSMTT
jgi:hypothetical protein